MEIHATNRQVWEQGQARCLETSTDAAGGPSFCPFILNRFLICCTLHTKLLLKSSPFILAFKALHQVTQSPPSFPMKAVVDLT